MADNANPKTLISYRRDDSSGWARGLYDRLAARYGAGRVFIDFDSIGSGDDFEQKIIDSIKASDVLLAIVGIRWLNATDERGSRRLDDERDPVRIELRTGLGQSIVLIPVLVDDAKMPKPDNLPEDIRRFSRLNAHRVGLKSFQTDVDDLVSEIDLQLTLAREKVESISPEARIQALERELAAAQAALAEEKARARRKVSRSRKPFDAFFVYSHRDGERLAAELQRALERLPAKRGRRLRIFRDTTDLAASPDLMSNLREMIDNSQFLILLASPSAAQSQWVNAELAYFRENRSSDNILTVLIAGDPESSMPVATADQMPLYVDFREFQDVAQPSRHPAFRAGVARLGAALYGIDLDELVDRSGRAETRRRALATLILCTIMILVAVAIALWISAT